jgi:predicted transcriptional regulator
MNDDRPTETDRRVLHVTVQDSEQFLRDQQDTASKALSGRRADSPRYHLNFDNHEQLQAILNAKNLRLLERVVRDEPESIGALARLLDRNASAVHRDLERLGEYGLVEFEAGEGRAKRPVVPYDEIDISVDLLGPDRTPITG